MAILVFGDPELNPALHGDQEGKNNSLIGLDNFGLNVLVGDTAFMYDFSLGGDDILEGGHNSVGGSIFNGLAGDALEMYDQSLGGHDILYGGDLAGNVNGSVTNYLLGDAMTMYAASQGGADEIHGGNNFGTGIVTNYLYGDAIEMNASSLAVLVHDHYGDPDDDHIHHHVEHHVEHDVNKNGKHHHVEHHVEHDVEHEDDDDDDHDHDDDHDDDDVDFITASPLGGNDILISGNNAIDYMWGDASNAPAGGADTFIFNDEVGAFFGDDIIYDFRHSDGDHIEIDFADVDSVDDLAFTDDLVSGNLVITVHGINGDHGTITLVGLVGVPLTVGHTGDPGSFDIII